MTTIRRSIILAVALCALAAGTARAASYDVPLLPGDAAIIWCGAALDVTAIPGGANVACIKAAASVVSYPGAPIDGDGLVYFVALNTDEDADVTCAGLLGVAPGDDPQTVVLGCQ